MIKMDNAVIGRRKIDSYVMYFAFIKKIPTIDISKARILRVGMLIVVVGIHQGRDTYNSHAKNHKTNDYYFNSQFYDDRNQRKASPRNCYYHFGTLSFFG